MDNTICGQKVERNYKGPASHLAELIDENNFDIFESFFNFMQVVVSLE